jgi:NADH-quinone oxidoreductase subunit E
MLSEAERHEIDVEMSHYDDKRAMCIEALKIVQHHRGWVSDEALRDVSEYIGIPVAELDGVATFFNLILRKPVGRHVIWVCDSVSCWVMGYESVRDYLSSKLGVPLGGTTPDGRFTLLPIVCLGACDRAPAMMVGEDLHGPLDPGKIDEILARYT